MYDKIHYKLKKKKKERHGQHKKKKKEYWSGLPFPSGDLTNPGVKPWSIALPADSSPSEP